MEKSNAVPSLDLKDSTEARLAACARRISQLLISPAVTANADAQSSLDDFLGAVYALIRAKQQGFRDRPGRPIAIKPVVQRAAKIAVGTLNGRTLGRWLLLQQRAVSHGRRLPPHAKGHHRRQGYLPTLLPKRTNVTPTGAAPCSRK